MIDANRSEKFALIRILPGWAQPWRFSDVPGVKFIAWRALSYGFLILAFLTIGSGIGGYSPFELRNAAAAPNANKETFIAQKIRLLERMMASRTFVKMKTEKDPAAKQQIDLINAKIKTGKEALTARDLNVAERLLDQALLQISALRSAKAKSRSKPLKEQKRLFSELKSGIQSYLASLSVGEVASNHKSPLQKIKKNVIQLIAKADRLADRNHYGPATQVLEKAQRIAVTAITKMRANSTITYALNFANPGEEYEYENQRNLSYKTLVRLRREKRGQTSRLNQQIEKLIRKSSDLRLQAENRANSQKVKAAIILMEESSQKLISVLRVLGLSVPN